MTNSGKTHKVLEAVREASISIACLMDDCVDDKQSTSSHRLCPLLAAGPIPGGENDASRSAEAGILSGA